jgi:hypothetical protein
VAVTSKLYGPVYQSVFNKEIDYDTDTIRAMLTTSTYTPNLDTHRYKSSVTNEVVGTGYTAGGVALTTKTVTYTAANSWGTSRANTTAYALGDVVRPATGNGFLYKAVVAGTSGGSIPTYPTVPGQTVVDGGVTWSNEGSAIVVFDADDPTWASSTITARYLVFYEDTGSAATSALISLVDFGADVSSTNAAFTYQMSPLGVAHFFSA